jgi:EAL domain-containing protein (putative c-di-GMP-specific phosphodiesterase class I)
VLVLDALRAMGIQLTIDDFGTGYSSLSYLKRFPIHSLKIDQSFVLDIATNSDDATIVSAVIGLGGNMKKRVIAEGVETLEQLAFLQMRKCKEGQGYLLSPPVAAIVFSQFLHRQQPPFNTPSVQTWQHLFS